MAEVREGRKRKYLDDYCERQAKYSRGSGFDFQNVPEQTGAGEGVNILNDEHVQRIEDQLRRHSRGRLAVRSLLSREIVQVRASAWAIILMVM